MMTIRGFMRASSSTSVPVGGEGRGGGLPLLLNEREGGEGRAELIADAEPVAEVEDASADLVRHAAQPEPGGELDRTLAARQHAAPGRGRVAQAPADQRLGQRV